MAKPKTSSKKIKKPIQQHQRQVDLPTYKSFRLSKRIKHTAPTIKPARFILRSAWLHLRSYWQVFSGLLIIYLLLNLMLVRGFGSGTDIASIKDTITGLFSGTFGGMLTNLSLAFVVATSSNAPIDETAGVYQSVLALFISLAIVWALRQTHAGNHVNAKQAFYQGMYPLVPFLLILVVIGLQLLPAVGGLSIINIVLTNGLAVTGAEQVVWYLFLALTCLLSLYMITSSIFALFIVTLADMTPLKALRSARQLVLHRRWMVVRRLIVLPLALVLLVIAVLLPTIYWLPSIAEWVFFVISGFMIIYSYSFAYSLYRELL